MTNKERQRDKSTEIVVTQTAKPSNKWLSVAVVLVRLVVGAIFIFSGLVKLIDPMGTMLKVEDYLALFDIHLYHSLVLMCSVVLSLIELVLGFNTLFGSYLRTTPRLLVIFMSFMTPLTLYLAIANPISDCGCFGDAVKLTNWETFQKNVFLLASAIFLLLFNNKARSLYHREMHLLIDSWVVVVGLFVAWLGTEYLPIIDFRPYEPGTNLLAAYYGEDEEDVTYDFVYSKEGERQTFTIDSLPNEADGWEFVERVERPINEAEETELTDSRLDHFVLYDGNDDVTEEVLSQEGYVFIMFSPDVTTANDNNIHRIHELHDYCIEYGYPFYAVTASSPADCEVWLDNTGGEYSFLFMDKSTIMTIARNNPFVMILHDGVIYSKHPIHGLPDESLLVESFDRIEPYGRQEEYDEDVNIALLLLLGFLLPLFTLYVAERAALFVLRNGRLWYRRIKNKSEEKINNYYSHKNKSVMRKNIVAGNWKMNTTLQEGIALAKEINEALKTVETKCDVVLATPFIHLVSVVEAVDAARIGVGAENCADKAEGAYTGEVSAKMVASTGAKYVILGHSERRAYYHETPEILKEKVLLALENGLTPIFCVGEVLEEREAEKHFDVVAAQIKESLFNLTAEEFGKLVIAYEPVWAIGTGKTATADQAQEIHAFIRKTIAEKYGCEVADNTSILYGGSCKPSNAGELFAKPDVDGGLIGGAALQAESFMGIITAF